MTKLADMKFHSYFHRYLVIEADDLTEMLKKQIRIHQDDCFVLCSNYISGSGLLQFNVLAVGKSWENCRRGLKGKMLGIFNPEEIMNKEARIVEPDLAMIRKNTAWLSANEVEADDEVKQTREDIRLDGIRDCFYPDIVMVGILSHESIREYEMRLIGFNGPFAEGRLLEEPKIQIGIHQNELIRALPYQLDTGFRLLAVFLGNHLSKEDQKAMKELIRESEAAGFGFSNMTVKN